MTFMWSFPRILSVKSMGTKRRKELKSGGTAQEEKPAGRERRQEKKNRDQVHESFNSKMQYEIKDS